jgi:hypothetical protein
MSYGSRGSICACTPPSSAVEIEASVPLDESSSSVVDDLTKKRAPSAG